jgi:hypothetical protein
MVRTDESNGVKTMPNITGTYKIRDGLVFNFEDLTDAMAVEGLTRAFNHVFGNECQAPASTENKKRKESGQPALTDEEYDLIVIAAQDKKLASIIDGTWGSGTRGPRALSANLEDVVFESVSNKMVRAYMAEHVKANRLAVKTKNQVWLNGTDEIPLDRATTLFFDAAGSGADRRAARDAAVIAEVASRKAAADARNATKAATADLF